MEVCLLREQGGGVKILAEKFCQEIRKLFVDVPLLRMLLSRLSFPTLRLCRSFKVVNKTTT